MQVFPSLRATRFAQLQAGELFIYEHHGGNAFGFVVADQAQDGDKLLLPLGPNLPPKMKWPMLQTPRGHSVISFGHDFVVQLPVSPDGWMIGLPPSDVQAILVAEDRTFFRASFAWDAADFSPCFIDIATGAIEYSGSGASGKYVHPGSGAYATRWRLLTKEREPRIILDYSGFEAQTPK